VKEMKKKKLITVLCAIIVFTLITMIMPTSIFATSFTISFSGDTAGNTFDSPYLPSIVGDWYYYARQIIPDSDGSYEIKVVGGTINDTILYLYEGCFDKDKPGKNLLAMNDDYGGTFWSEINYDLEKGKKYVVVVSSYYSNETGIVDVDVTGPGKVSVSAKYNKCKASGTALEEEIWVRDVDMTCYQVWINEDNNFEFVFWWEYESNNWVQIFDMAGNLVFEIDMEKGNAHFEAELPDGMYTVKTFHEAGHILQEFMIGKP
jgi:hypothetical protein